MQAFRGFHKRTILVADNVQTETIFETPIMLETTKPATPHLSITVTAEMLPVIRGAAEIGYKQQLIVNSVTQKNAATSAYIYADIYVNGVLATGTRSQIISASYLSCGWLTSVPVEIGDLVEVFYRCSVAGLMSLVALRWTFYPSQLGIAPKKNRNIFVVSFRVLELQHLFSGTITRTATFNTASDNCWYRQPNDRQANYYTGQMISSFAVSITSPNNYISGGLAGMVKDTTLSRIIGHGIYTGNNRGSVDTSTTLPYPGAFALKKVEAYYKIL